jgi:glutaminyl-tRNA synthetase
MASDRNDFLRDIIDADLAAGRQDHVATRFPPEPNGYLHIGHAKSICLNFGLAGDYQGTCNLRYDDTNPAKEDVEYVDSIERDVRWLGFAPAAVLFSADYFPRMYELAERLVRDRHAYVCSLDDEQIRVYRGTLSEPGRPSPDRDRSVVENLELLRRMKAGDFGDGTYTLRAKIDMASANMKMRDPLLYRIRHAHHHRSGDAWCIYPMYDYAHPLEDAIEGITHSICTLEFENNRELYDWVLDHTGPWSPRPRQYEFARLALDYTIMSKRKLLALVDGGHVRGWDDPRMPTIAGMRRRGYAPEAIRAFCDLIGVAKTNSMVDIGKLEYCVRQELDRNTPRTMGVIDPLEVVLDTGQAIYIDRADWSDDPPDGYRQLAIDRRVRLRQGPDIIATAKPGDDRVLAKVVPGSEGSPPERGIGIIHWVDAATSVVAEVRLYDRLFASAKPEEGGADFLHVLSPDSLVVTKAARVTEEVATAPVGSRWQLVRVGYFRVDEDARPGAPVLNRIAALRDDRKEAAEVVDDAAAKPHARNPKAQTRPKSRSPREYRDEARARDAELAAFFEALTHELPADQAELLSGDRVTMALYQSVRRTANVTGATLAKFVINEVPIERRAALVGDGAFAQLVAEAEANYGAAKRAFASGTMHVAVTSGVDLAAIDAVLSANPDKVAQYKAGKAGLLGFFVGQIMKGTPGLDAAQVNAAVRERLGS